MSINPASDSPLSAAPDKNPGRRPDAPLPETPHDALDGNIPTEADLANDVPASPSTPSNTDDR